MLLAQSAGGVEDSRDLGPKEKAIVLHGEHGGTCVARDAEQVQKQLADGEDFVLRVLLSWFI